MRLRRILFYISSITISAVAILAQASSSARGVHPDPIIHSEWTGYYTIVTGKDLGALRPINPNLNQVVTDHLQPWAKAKMATMNGTAEDTGAVCMPDGFFRFLPAAGRFLWLPARDRITLVNDEINTAGVVRIHLDRPHPRNLQPTWNGDSIGHWREAGDGDTLVVDTIGFNDQSWLMTAMQPHTEETHMIQKIQRVESAGNSYLEIHTTVEDRQALTSAYEFSRYYKKSAGEMPELICADEVAEWKEWRNKALRPLIDRSRVVK